MTNEELGKDIVVMDSGSIRKCVTKAGDVNAGVLLLYLILLLNEGRYADHGSVKMPADKIAGGVGFTRKQYTRALRILTKGKLVLAGRAGRGALSGDHPKARITCLTLKTPTISWARGEDLLPQPPAARGEGLLSSQQTAVNELASTGAAT